MEKETKLKIETSAGDITVKLYNESPKHRDNFIKLVEDGKAYVSVKDRGETVPPDDLPFIFDRFHKSDHSRSLDKDGVGLGLYLVKTIINSHDEDIAVTSRDGVTEFVFTLALSEPEKAEPRLSVKKERTEK